MSLFLTIQCRFYHLLNAALPQVQDYRCLAVVLEGRLLLV